MKKSIFVTGIFVFMGGIVLAETKPEFQENHDFILIDPDDGKGGLKSIKIDPEKEDTIYHRLNQTYRALKASDSKDEDENIFDEEEDFSVKQYKEMMIEINKQSNE